MSFSNNSSASGGGVAAWGAASVQGARQAQEDLAQVLNAAGNRCTAFCVHDGHAGTGAVLGLADFLRQRVQWPERAATAAWSRETTLAFMANVFLSAGKHLQNEASGVVSVVALCMPRRVCFAWMGDCQGALFRPREGVLRMPHAMQLDVAETPDFDPSSLFLQRICRDWGQRRLAATTPHTLTGAIPDIRSCCAQPPGRPAPEFFASGHAPGCVLHLHASLPEGARFLNNPAAQREYDLACAQQPDRTPLPLEITLARYGDHACLLTDARFGGSVQPTRVLGDRDMTPDMGTLRQPMVLWVPLPRPASDDKGNSNNNTEPPPHVLLCSDGAFAGNAFADMDALACFLGDPMAYVRECFYERGHELTERLLLAKKLTMDPFRLAEGGRSELETAWRRCETWVQFLHFLQTYHWREVCSPAMAQTFSDEARDMLPIAHEQFLAYATPITTTTTTKLPPPPPAAAANAQRREHGVDHGFMEWLRACDASIRWLVEHTTVEGPPSLARCSGHSLTLAAESAAHMAVVMGSTDNVTVVVARLAPFCQLNNNNNNQSL